MFDTLNSSEDNRYWEVHVDRLSGDYSLAFHFTAVAYFDHPGKDFEGGSLVFQNVSLAAHVVELLLHGQVFVDLDLKGFRAFPSNPLDDQQLKNTAPEFQSNTAKTILQN